ncbi:MAG: cyanophycinase [Sphingobacteriales bacterium]|nr:MAG: cyanophycinase [Sphingobacteriales bacterium]
MEPLPTPVPCTVPNGCLIIIGGAENKESAPGPDDKRPAEAKASVLSTFIEQCAKKHPRIEVVTTAGEEDVKGTFKEYKRAFESLGAGEVAHIHHDHRDEIDEQAMRDRIRKADGVFMAGGDQLRLTSIYGGTPFLTDLKKAYLFDKLTVSGTSAGAMALSTPMIFAGTGEQEMIVGGVKLTTGLEFLKDVCIDTHFVHRGRFVRMAQVIATNPASIGIGIEENTALVITEGLHARVVGTGVVIVIDGVNSRSSNITNFGEDARITVRDLNVSILAEGEQFEIPQRNPPHQ